MVYREYNYGFHRSRMKEIMRLISHLGDWLRYYDKQRLIIVQQQLQLREELFLLQAQGLNNVEYTIEEVRA